MTMADRLLEGLARASTRVMTAAEVAGTRTSPLADREALVRRWFSRDSRP